MELHSKIMHWQMPTWQTVCRWKEYVKYWELKNPYGRKYPNILSITWVNWSREEKKCNFWQLPFTNPKARKVSDAEDAGGSMEPIFLEKYPEWGDFIKMQQHISVASDYGIEIDLERYGITMMQ